MDRNWNRGGGNSAGGEKMYKHYSGGQHYQNYRKKNDFSGQEYYSKIAKPVVVQPQKKEGLQVSLVENELMDVNFSWVKNGGTQVSS